jgi:hypothetical protein
MVQVERVDRFKRQIDFRANATTNKIDRRMDPKKQRRSKGRQASADRINKDSHKGSSNTPSKKRGSGGSPAKKSGKARPFKTRR